MNKKVLIGSGIFGAVVGAFVWDKLKKEVVKEVVRGMDLLEEENPEIDESEIVEEGIGLEKALSLSNQYQQSKAFEITRLKCVCTNFGKYHVDNKERRSFDIEYLDHLGRTKFKAEVEYIEKDEVESLVVRHFNTDGEEESRFPVTIKGGRYVNIRSTLSIIEKCIKTILHTPCILIDYDVNIDRLISSFEK